MLNKSYGLLFCKIVSSQSVCRFCRVQTGILCCFLPITCITFLHVLLLFVKQSCLGYCVYHGVSYAQNVKAVFRNPSPWCLCWHPEWSSEISWWRDSFRHPEDQSSPPTATDTRYCGCSASGQVLFWLWAWNIVVLLLNTVNVTHRRQSHSTRLQ